MYSGKVKIVAFFAFAGLLLAIETGNVFKADQMPSMILWVVGIALSMITVYFAHSERQAEQEHRDSFAQQVAEETEHGNIPFVLYLRPFGLEVFFRAWGNENNYIDNLFLDGGKMNFD